MASVRMLFEGFVLAALFASLVAHYDEVKRGVDTLALLLRGWADVDLRAATSGAKS